MANCIGVVTEKIRAVVELSGVTIKTPYVKAFNVEKARQQLGSTFSATVEVLAGSRFMAGNDIVIRAGLKDSEKKIFTGVIKSISVQPSFDKAGYYVLSISGVDRLADLEGRTFSRRLKSDGLSQFVSITGGPSNRPSRGASIDKKVTGGSHTFTSKTPDPKDIQNSTLIRFPERGNTKQGGYMLAETPGDWRRGEGGGLGIHDHTTQGKGGPAFGVFSSD